MLKRNVLGKLGVVLGAFVLSLSGFGLAGPGSPARADEAPSDRVSPVGVDGQGNPLEVTPAMAAALSHESSATEGAVEASAPGDGGGEAIIGSDDRRHVTNTTDFPNRAIVYIHQPNGSQHCTGWLVSPDTVVTAGHCVYNEGNWIHGLEFSPGANGSERPYGTATMKAQWTDVGWVSRGDDRLDWGIVKLNRSFPEVGYFGYRWQRASLNCTNVEIRGYPGDKPAGELWGMAGPIRESGGNNLYYDMDTFAGQSGSPVFLGDVAQSVAIHTGWSASKHNRSTRITESLFNIISELRR